ncbi:universal stress protein [Natrarchaeobius oligotrophus]|uniref:Universal stress protein n=1 Tax=Natrarchaeobius chitinivorans TaxID=1679083 RepID=A0A3N6PSU1_NATCH|nr:universal stress protein [Natrarchaeobius chitinivorans]RQH02636.1 universal stress protein [Natrarchaeobius chitinivorans]
MNRGLVVLDDTETHRALLEEAGAFASSSDSELVVLSYLTSEEVESNLDTIETISEQEGTSYDSTVALQPAEQFASSMAAETIADLDLSYEIETRVIDEDDLGDAILETAYDTDCDHVFLVGRKRSPTGKAIFGDVVQQVILNFEGRVTVDVVDSA